MVSIKGYRLKCLEHLAERAVFVLPSDHTNLYVGKKGVRPFFFPENTNTSFAKLYIRSAAPGMSLLRTSKTLLSATIEVNLASAFFKPSTFFQVRRSVLRIINRGRIPKRVQNESKPF